MNKRLAALERVHEDFETDGVSSSARCRAWRSSATSSPGDPFNSEPVTGRSRRVCDDDGRELKEWQPPRRAPRKTPRRPMPSSSPACLETTDFGEWLTAKLDEAIAAMRTFEPRSTKELRASAARSTPRTAGHARRAEVAGGGHASPRARPSAPAASAETGYGSRRFLTEYGSACAVARAPRREQAADARRNLRRRSDPLGRRAWRESGATKVSVALIRAPSPLRGARAKSIRRSKSAKRRRLEACGRERRARSLVVVAHRHRE